MQIDSLQAEVKRPDFSAVVDEQALLGMVLLDNRRYHEIAHLLRPEDFGCEAHRRLWDAIGKLVRNGYRADPLALRITFRAHSRAFPEGDPALYLVRLVTFAVWIEYRPIRTYALCIKKPAPQDRVIDVLVRYRNA